MKSKVTVLGRCLWVSDSQEDQITALGAQIPWEQPHLLQFLQPHEFKQKSSLKAFISLLLVVILSNPCLASHFPVSFSSSFPYPVLWFRNILYYIVILFIFFGRLVDVYRICEIEQCGFQRKITLLQGENVFSYSYSGKYLRSHCLYFYKKADLGLRNPLDLTLKLSFHIFQMLDLR